MITKEKILEITRRKGKITSKEFATSFNVSRQSVSMLISQLIADNKLIRIGSTRNAIYIVPEYLKEYPHLLPSKFSKRFKNSSIEEHKILAEIEGKFPLVKE